MINKFIKILFMYGATLHLNNLYAQETENKDTTRINRQHTVFLELLGNGLPAVGTLNYEYTLRAKDKVRHRLRFGLMGYPQFLFFKSNFTVLAQYVYNKQIKNKTNWYRQHAVGLSYTPIILDKYSIYGLQHATYSLIMEPISFVRQKISKGFYLKIGLAINYKFLYQHHLDFFLQAPYKYIYYSIYNQLILIKNVIPSVFVSVGYTFKNKKP